jgi:cell division protein ZapA
MPSYNLSILGQEISFRADVEESRIREAEQLIRQKFDRLNTYGTRMSNEKLLILVALSLADDYLQTNQKLLDQDTKLRDILEKIDQYGVDSSA